MVLSYISREMRPGMHDQLREEAPSDSAQAWDIVRRVREPIAWALLVIAAIAVVVSAWQLFGLPGAPVPAPPTPSPVAVASFAWRASAVAPQFVTGGIFLLPLVSVVLVAFAGGLTSRARLVVQSAVSVQAVALGLGLLSWLGAFGSHSRQAVWFIFDAVDLAALAVALIFTVAVLQSRALRPLAPQFDDFEDDEGLAGEDA
jgi:hypothetical protein